MSDQDYGVLLHDANDVLPLGLVGTPWEIIFKALRDVLKSGVGASDSDFMRKACALYFLARGDLDAVTDRSVLNGIAAALFIPYWVENFESSEQASAIIYHWIKYKPTRPNLTALALASGMRAFRLRETYTSTEYGLSHSFGFDLGEGYDTSFFAGPNATPGLETAQRICGALTHFFLRIKDSPTLITDITYPDALPHGAQFYFRPDQSEIRILQGYNWDLYDENGELAQKIDEYAYYIPSVTRNSYGVNTEIVPPTHLIFLSDGQIRVSWEQSPTSAYALFAEVGINIPDKTRGWLSISHVDVNLPPNAIPGATLFDEEGDPITGEGWEIFAAYNQALNRLDTSDLYLAGTDPVRIRSDKYIAVCQVWLTYTPPEPPPPEPVYSYIVFDTTTGTIVHSIVDEGLVYGEVGYVLMDETSQMIAVYETGVRTESFYFTTNGRNETQNTDISHADIPVYLEDGTAPAADTPYNGSSVLAFMDVTGNTKQADGESLYLDDGVLRLDAPDTDEGEQWAALVEFKAEIVLKVKWGDTVNVPSGYKVSEVRTFVGYANKSYYGDYSQWEQLVTYEGKNKYFDNIDGHNLIITSTNSATDSAWPLIVASQGYQLNNTTGPHMQVLDFGAGYKNATSYWGFSDVQTNGTDAQAGDFSVLLRGQASSTVINAINSGYPVRFLWFIIDGEGNAVWHKTPEAFRVPNSLWSFANGVFSWLGNSEDTSSLAWYYKHDWELFEWEEFDGVWFYVHCVYDPTPEPPAPSLPTVSKIGVQEGSYWLAFNSNGAAADFGSGQTSPIYYNSGGYNYIQQPYDSTRLYAVIALHGSGITIRNGVNVENGAGNLFVRNSTGNNYSSLYGGYIAQCDDLSATVITVYKDSDGTAYNSFKYTASGTDYYYVLDGTQTDWTDDLSGIGYSLASPLPRVHSMTGRLGSNSSGTGSSSINFSVLVNGRLWFFKLDGGSYSKAVVNEGTVLAVAKINNTSNEPQYYGFVARRVASDGTVRLMNNTYSTYKGANSVDIYYCEDPSVGIVTVTNGNGDKFWAFKCLADGVAYYYVLDLSSGSLPSQSWVSDLSSLGYAIFNAQLYYLSSDKTPISVGGGSTSPLYGANGVALSYNSSRQYRIINAYTSADDLVGIGCESFIVSSSMSYATLYNRDVLRTFYSVEIVIT